jgi:hypothetical protein
MRIVLSITFVVCSVLASFLWRGSQTEAAETQVTSGSCESASKDEDSSQTEVCAVPESDKAPSKADDSLLAEKAVRICLNSPSEKSFKRAHANAMLLLKAESEMGVPDVMRGMTLAAACIESGFSANAEGDHRFSKDGKTPMAIGILQMWPFYERAYHTNRRDVTSAATAWLTHIKKQIPSITKRCQPKNLDETWRIAWVTGVNAPKKGGRCHETVSHYKFLQKIKSSLVDRT